MWSKLKIPFSELKKSMSKIFALEEKHKIRREIKFNPDQIENIFAWFLR